MQGLTREVTFSGVNPIVGCRWREKREVTLGELEAAEEAAVKAALKDHYRDREAPSGFVAWGEAFSWYRGGEVTAQDVLLVGDGATVRVPSRRVLACLDGARRRGEPA